jgi:carboxyl-terminal processing protease
MQLNGLLSSLLAITVFLAGSISLPAWSAQSAPEKQNSAEREPLSIYNRVWQLVHNSFYEPSYNGQDWDRWQHRYDTTIKTSADAYKAVDTMLASLGDRYTRFLTPEAFKEETEMIAAKLFGIGIQMGYDKTHKIIVIAPIPDTPAARAGLMPLDEIIEVDGKSTQGMSVEAVSKMVRGELNTPVKITIERNKERKTLTIIRGEIPIKSVQKTVMLNSDIGYVRLSTFISSKASEEMKEALSQLLPARGIIIDLRDNPGGLVTNAVDICNIFLNGGIIVSTINRRDHKVSTVSSARPFCKQPLVVLINQGSASASEITAGALHDHDRAQLVGQKSFGKGLVQAIEKLADGSSVHITIARYLTPNGTDINKKGIGPDFEVKLTKEDYQAARGPWWLDPGGPTVKRSPGDLKDVQLKKAVEVLDNAISNVQSPYELKLNFPGFGPSIPDIGIQERN